MGATQEFGPEIYYVYSHTTNCWINASVHVSITKSPSSTGTNKLANIVHLWFQVSAQK